MDIMLFGGLRLATDHKAAMIRFMRTVNLSTETINQASSMHGLIATNTKQLVKRKN